MTINILDRVAITFSDHIADVRLIRADKMNALDQQMIQAIPQVKSELDKLDDLRVVILSGEGGNFCAGLDKSNFASMIDKGGVSADGAEEPKKLEVRTHGIANIFQYLAWMWRELPVPVIVAIEGVALGGGLQIALGGDVRFASPNSRYSILEMKWGLVPDMSSSQIMRHMIRDDVIRELTYTARVFDAQEAQRHGFITHITEQPLEQAFELAKEIANKNPDAIRGAKRIIEQSYYQSAAEGLMTESIEQDQIIGQANQIEAVMSELQKRAPQFNKA